MILWQIRKYERETRNKRKQNTRIVITCLTQRAQRARRTSLSSNNIFIILCGLCALCVRKENICVVIIYLTQRTQRTRSFISHTVHADAGDVASYTATGERRARMANEYSKQLLISANLCVLLSRVASDLSQAITFLKFFATSAPSACGKTSVW